MARLDATTGMADLFDPNANARILSIAVQADGKILAGGDFTSIGGQARNHIARLDAASGLADSFDPNASTTVYSIAIQADGKILAGGAFNGTNSIGGQARNRIARLDPVTGMADSFDANANGRILSLAVQPDGKILAGGDFDNVGGQTRVRVARLDAVSGLADSFDPTVSNRVYAIAVQTDGKILVGFSFSDSLAPSSVGGEVRNGVARLETDGRLDKTLGDLTITGAMGTAVIATAIQPDGKILIGGLFDSVLGVARNNIARLNTDGTLDTTFDPNGNGAVFSIVVLKDGKILVGGRFTSIGGQARNCIARLDKTGLADSFNPALNGVGPFIRAIAVQADDKILVGGYFTSIGGQARHDIARLNATTGLADSFNPNVSGNGAVSSIAIQADSKILVGGDFTNIGGQARNRIARLDASVGLADSFDPEANGVNSIVVSIAVQGDGKILAGGQFTTIGGQIRHDFARLDANTGLADSFEPNPDNWVKSITVQADGRILVGGDFNIIGGQVRNRIARLDGDTGLADSFNPNTNADEFNQGVNSIAVATDGKILAGGGFTVVGGQPRNLFARVTNDAAALQSLTVTQTVITWSRGGINPQLRRVTFEYSADNVNYTSLGNGTAVGSSWTLTGLNLPAQQNFYIRARGYYGSGYANSSESITETVRNVFLRGASLTRVISRKFHGATAFGVDLPTGGNPGIECRSGGINGDYQLVFSFANPLTSVANASVTTGTGSVTSHMIDADPHNYIVNLTGVSNQQVITVDLTNVNDVGGGSSSSISVSMGVLVGDINGNGSVNASDIIQAKLRSGHVVDDSNFRNDVTVDGSINATDVSLVKSRSGTALPADFSQSRPDRKQ
jgi:uncharacterized delta-60 repeat protein